MALDPIVMSKSKLNNKFRRTPEYTRDMMLRDLIELVEALDKRLTDIEARLTAGGH